MSTRQLIVQLRNISRHLKEAGMSGSAADIAQVASRLTVECAEAERAERGMNRDYRAEREAFHRGECSGSCPPCDRSCN